jgi:hypothetical protein
MKTQTLFDNVLSFQGWSTPQGAVIDDNGAMVEW